MEKQNLNFFKQLGSVIHFILTLLTRLQYLLDRRLFSCFEDVETASLFPGHGCGVCCVTQWHPHFPIKGKVMTSDARESSVLFAVPGKKDGGEQGFTGEQKQSRVNREAEETQTSL